MCTHRPERTRGDGMAPDHTPRRRWTHRARQGGLTLSAPSPESSVDLYWIPLGAGHHSVRINGIVYETVKAAIERRLRCDLYHSVLCLRVPSGSYWVEMTPTPDCSGADRGVVAEGPVGLQVLGRSRLFRYEVRRWRDGVVPDLDYAVGDPVRVSDDDHLARRVFDLLPAVPCHVWGRDVLHVGDMWSCNSVVSWALASAGVDVTAIPLPPNGRAPGWDAGLAAASPAPFVSTP